MDRLRYKISKKWFLILPIVILGFYFYHPKIINKGLGTDCSLILNDGLVAQDGEHFYYSKIGADQKLYSLDLSNDTERQITKRKILPYNLNIVSNEYIFFLNGIPGSICRIKKNGGIINYIYTGAAENLVVVDNNMYFIDNFNVYKSELNGKNQRLIIAGAKDFIVYNNNIFYKNINDNNKLYFSDLNGKINIKFIDMQPFNYKIYNSYLFFSDYQTDKLYKVNLNNINDLIYITDDCSIFYIINDKIYFIKTDDYSICSMSMDGTNLNTIFDDEYSIIGNINITQDKILFQRLNYKTGWYICNLDGSKLNIIQ